MLISKLMSSIFSWANALGAYKFILESGFCPRLCSFSKKNQAFTLVLSYLNFEVHMPYQNKRVFATWVISECNSKKSKHVLRLETCFETQLIQLNSSQLVTYMIALISQASLDSCCVKPTINLGWRMRSVYRRQQSKLLAAKKKLQVLSPHEWTYLVIVLQNYLELEL